MAAIKNKRIFTHHMTYGQPIIGAAWEYTLSADQFLAQESIDIVGVELNIEMCDFNQNDNLTMAYAELSQNGGWAQDGSIMREQADAAWNTVPAFGYYNKGFRSQMFPSGDAIPLKEEGVLYLHVQCLGAAAGQTVLAVHANIFYTKA